MSRGEAADTKKGAARPLLVVRSRPGKSRRRGRLGVRRLHRSGILALGLDVAIDELDHRDRRVVAVAEARLHDAQIAAVTLLVAWADDLEQLLDHRDVADLGDRLAPRMQVAALAERDQLFDDRA